MKVNRYMRSLLVVAIFAMALICLGQSVTTEDLLGSARGLMPDKDAVQISAPEEATTNTGTNDGMANQPPSAKTLTPDRDSPQFPGTVVVWTATAYDPEGDGLLYQFWLNGPATGNVWKPMTNWSESNVWSWSTNPIDGGNNIIDVRVADGYHAGPDRGDSHLSAEFFITEAKDAESANSMPYILSLKSDRQSPQDQGTKVTWTTTASDPDSDTVLYQYWIKGPSTEEQWLPVTPWTTSRSWTWNTAQMQAGIYTVEARIRDGYHADAENADDYKRGAFVVKQTGIIK